MIDAGHADMLARLIALSPVARGEAIGGLSEAERRALHESWAVWANPGQRPPATDWRFWLIRAGRGFGKTRAGAEWVRGVARANPEGRIALVGSTEEDVVRVMVEGQSGLRTITPAGEPYVWRRDAGEFEFASGARAFVFSAMAADKLRGPEHHAAWCDEIAKWHEGGLAWDNLLLGLRLGEHQQVLVTTTPQPVPLMRRIMALPDLVETHGSTHDNPYLPPSFIASMTEIYGGTRLGRQELGGELIEDIVGALWTRGRLEACRVTTLSETVVRVVVGVDPPAGVQGTVRAGGANNVGDACGIVAVALAADGFGYVLEDASVAGASPEGWARAVADCAARHGADLIVAEKNQGGDMVRSVLEGADRVMPIRLVHASKGKVTRAEPVAALYERERAYHVGRFPALEDEMCGLVAGGVYAGPGRSPDRADALVWAMTELLLRPRRMPGVRSPLG